MAIQLPCESDLGMIAQFNRTQAPFPDKTTLQELIETTVAKNLQETAVICDHDKAFGVPSLSYAQLNEKVNQLAHLLRAGGIRPGNIVGLMVDRSFAMIIGILAAIKAGAAYLPLSPENPPERIEYMLKNAGVKILLTNQNT